MEATTFRQRASVDSNTLNGRLHVGHAVALDQLGQPLLSRPAGRELGPHVAHGGVREADVVRDHLEQVLVVDAFADQRQLVELQALKPGVHAGPPGAEPGAHPADVGPVSPGHREREQLAVDDDRRVGDDVVEVLPGHPLVVHDEAVAGLEPVDAVALDGVVDDDAEVGHEVGDAADVLRQEPALLVHERAAVVADLVDHHVVRPLLEVEGHLVGDGRERVAHDLDGYRISHWAALSVPVEPAEPATAI
jgi:hypothetical protein